MEYDFFDVLGHQRDSGEVEDDFFAMRNREMGAYGADQVFVGDNTSTDGLYSGQQGESPQQLFDFMLPKLEGGDTVSNSIMDESRPPRNFLSNRKQVFTIIRDGEPAVPKVLSKQTKRIVKPKEAPKQIKKSTSPVDQCSTGTSNVNEMIEAEMKNHEHLDERSKKRMIQMLRNKNAAQLSRDRKKMYISNLVLENFQLRNELIRTTTELAAEKQINAQMLCRHCGRSNAVEPQFEDLLEPNTPMDANAVRTPSARAGGFRGFFSLLTIVALCAVFGVMNYGGSDLSGGAVGNRASKSHLEEIHDSKAMNQSITQLYNNYRLENQKLTIDLEKLQTDFKKFKEELSCDHATEEERDCRKKCLHHSIPTYSSNDGSGVNVGRNGVKVGAERPKNTGNSQESNKKDIKNEEL